MTIEINKEYQWNQSFRSSFATVDINLVVKELEDIQKQSGEITPSLIVEKAKVKDSILHDYFEWNNKEAANQYRLQQASELLRRIEVKVIKDGEPFEIRAFELVRRPNQATESEYKRFDLLTPENIVMIQKSIVNDLHRIKTRLIQFSSFNEAVVHIEKAIDELSKESTEAKEDEKATVVA